MITLKSAITRLLRAVYNPDIKSYAADLTTGLGSDGDLSFGSVYSAGYILHNPSNTYWLMLCTTSTQPREGITIPPGGTIEIPRMEGTMVLASVTDESGTVDGWGVGDPIIGILGAYDK